MKLIHSLLLAPLVALFKAILFGPPAARTCDVAYTYRMGNMVPGEVTRTHPAGIFPMNINTTTPIAAYGNICINDGANGVRGVLFADQSATPLIIAGIAVRPYPIQQQSGGPGAALGSATPPTSGVIDVGRQCTIMVKLKTGSTVVKGGTPYVWATATAGANIQNEFQSAASAGNTVPISNAKYMGPADANGYVELEVWPA